MEAALDSGSANERSLKGGTMEAALNSGSANERSLKGGTMEAALDSGSANDSGSAISVPPYRLVPPMKGRPYPLGHWGSGRTMATAL